MVLRPKRWGTVPQVLALSKRGKVKRRLKLAAGVAQKADPERRATERQ